MLQLCLAYMSLPRGFVLLRGHRPGSAPQRMPHIFAQSPFRQPSQRKAAPQGVWAKATAPRRCWFDEVAMEAFCVRCSSLCWPSAPPLMVSGFLVAILPGLGMHHAHVWIVPASIYIYMRVLASFVDI